MPRKHFPYIKTVTSRGKVYEYFDTGRGTEGKPVYIRLPHRSDRSWGQVYAGLVGARKRRASVIASPTMAELSRRYQKGDKWPRLSESTQNTYLIYLRLIEDTMGAADVTDIHRRDVQALMDKMVERPGAAAMALLVLRNLFKHAIQREWVKADPTDGVEPPSIETAEYQPWPEPLLEAGLVDPEMRLAIALLYYTAQRIGDVCKMRWSDIREGYLYVKQQKTGKTLDLKLHAELVAVLNQTPRTAMTLLHGPDLRPRRAATLRLHLQAFAAKHGEKIVPHGLRKNAVIALLEVGCTMAETAAISGQSLSVVEHYAKGRNNKRIGTAAVLRWERNGT